MLVVLGLNVRNEAIFRPRGYLADNQLLQPPLSVRYTTRPTAHPGGDMMEPNEQPLDPMYAATLVIQVIDDIDERNREQRDALLNDLICAAWPTQLAQDS